MPPYLTREVFSRCLRIIERTCMAHATPGHPDPPDKDFIVCSLDLLSGMAEGLGQSIESLVGPSNLFQLMFHCMKVGATWPFAIAPAVLIPARTLLCTRSTVLCELRCYSAAG